MKKIVLFVLLLVGLGISASADEVCMPLMPSSPSGQFGCSVYLKGPSLVVGSHLDGGGSITAYRQTQNGSWSPVGDDAGKVRANDGQLGDQFGSSAWIDGNWLAVGAPFANGSGAVYLFQRATETSGWVQAFKLTASDGARGDQLGLTVAISGTTLIVGAPNVVGHAGSLSGAVYVFRFDGSTWAPQQKLAASDAAPFDNFGFSLAIDGSTLIVGAPFHDRGSAGGNAGAAYVFGQDAAGVWSQRTKLTASDGAANDEFGSAVTLSGGSLAVGARADDANGLVDVGSAYVYQQQSDASWREAAHFFGQAAGDRFGAAVSMSGNRLLIGALLHDGSGLESGAAYLYSRLNGMAPWAPEPFPFPAPAAGGRFGQAVSIDGENLLVGAYLAPPGGAGAATVCGPGSNPRPHTFKVVKDDGQTEVSHGQVLTYTLTVTNTGKDDAAAVQVTDPVSAKLRDVSCRPDCVRASPGILTWTFPLAAQASKILHVTGTVRSGATGSLTNTACAQVPGEAKAFCGSDPPDEIVPPRCTPVDLKLVKIAAPASVQPGHRLTYTLTVTNGGTCLATGVHLQDPIPAELQVVSTTPSCSILPGRIACDLPDLAFLASATVKLHFDVLETCTPTITNQATVWANEERAVLSNIVTTAIKRVADVMVTKTGPASVPPGGLMPYVLTVKNLGPDIACGVVVNDPIPAGLTSPVFPTPPPPCSISIPTNRILCQLGDMVAGSSRPIPVSFTAPTTCGSPPITNIATVSADPPTADPNPVNDAGMVTTARVDDVSITKTVSPATASPGDTLDYTIVVSNPGGFPATITDVFPAGLTSVLWCKDGNSGSCPPSQAGDIHDSLSDASATYRVRAKISPMFPGTMLVNTATVAVPPGCDPDLSNNTAIVLVPITPSVMVLCQGITGSQLAGGTITYTFLLVNNGLVAQSNVLFSDPLPPGLTPTATSASSGTVSLPPANPVTWQGPIPVGGTVTLTITAMIDPLTEGTTFCNVPTIQFDRDSDGINESVGAVAVPCCFTIPARIPTLSGSALAVLALLLTLTALRRLRRRSL